MNPTATSSNAFTNAIGHPLTVQELIKQMLGDLRTTRTELDRTLSEVREKQLRITHLCSNYVSTIDLVNKHSTILSPIRRAPHEILYYIFQLAVESDGERALSSSSTAVRITHVSEEWRRIALRTTSLWSTFRIVPPRYPFPHASYWEGDGSTVDFNTFNSPEHQEYLRGLERVLITAKVWVSRSGSRPLDIDFDATRMIEGFRSFSIDGNFDNEEISTGLEHNVFAPAQQLINYLVTLSHRWRSISAVFPIVSALTNFQQMLNIPAAHTQCLERLDITLDYDFFSSHKDSPYYSESAPDLLTPVKSNSLNLMLHPEVEMKEIPINWSGLTHLTFSTRRYHFQAISPQGFEALEWTGMCLSLLSSCPNLEYCDFQMPQLWSSSEPWQLTDDVTTARMISLPNLRSLKISRISEVPLGFASRLELPVLENLTLMCEYTDPEPKEGSQSSLLEFVQRFGPTLLKSTIHYIDLTQQSLYECLQSLPNVVTLRLTGERGCSFAQHAGLTGELLKKMNGKKRLCPKLQNLALRLGSRDDLTHAILTDFIIARRPAARSNSGQSSNATLRSLKIKLHGTSGSKFTIRENLALRRAEIEDLEGFVLTEEFGSRQRPPWEIRAVDPDLNF